MPDARQTSGLAVATGADSAALVLYGQRSRFSAAARPPIACPHKAKGARLRGPEGEWIELRCKRRNCPYCGRLADYELLQCLLIDSAQQLPSIIVTLTTVAPWREHRSRQLAAAYRTGSQRTWEALRTQFGRGVEYFGSIEFTTGKAEKSGGDRRMHGHYLVKGMDPAMCTDAQRTVRRVWRRSTGAWRVQVAPLAHKGGIAAYLGLHHRKAEQLPPKEWRGMTARASQGYWHRPIAEIREQARHEQAIRRTAWLMVNNGATKEEAQLLAPLEADHQRAQWADHEPEIVRVVEHAHGSRLVSPVRPR